MRKLYCKYFIVFLCVFYACKGPEGDPGPQGTPGQKGDKGDKGEQGAPGANGLSAKSYTFNVVAPDWKFDPFLSDAFVYEKSVPGITKKIVEEDLVLAYFRIVNFPENGNYGAWQSLPRSESNQVFTEYFGFTYEPGKVGFVYWYKNTNNDSPFIFNFDIQLRVVIIPTIPGGRRKTVDYKNYEEVKKTFNLPD